MRIGGVFSDWCELPPLYSLIRMWSRRGPIGRCIPGVAKRASPISTAMSWYALSAASSKKTTP